MTEPLYEAIDEMLSYDAILEEAQYLNTIEKNIPDLLRIQLELDIISKRRSNVSCYKTLLNNKNLLVEHVSKHIGHTEANILNESYKTLVRKIKQSRLNEQDFSEFSEFGKALINNSGTNNTTTAQTAPSNKKTTTSTNIDAGDSIGNAVNSFFGYDGTSKIGTPNTGEEKSLYDSIKKLANSITEGGSPIGILHLILDIVGVVGDFPPFSIFGIGLIADLLNGIIYFMRGKHVLGVISIIAAVIPVGGPILKNMFKSSKTGKNVIW
jgi:hypothetical protein